MKLRDILDELKKLKRLAYINKFNTFNKNAERTKQEVEDFLDKEWIEK